MGATVAANEMPEFADTIVPQQMNSSRGGRGRDQASESESDDYSQNKLGDSEKNAQADVGAAGPLDNTPEPSTHYAGRFPGLMRHRRQLVHLAVGMIFTGWWVASLVLHHGDMNWVVPFLVWLAIMARLLFWYVPIAIVSKPIYFVWQNTAVRISNMVPEKLRTLAGAAVAIAAILVGAFVSEETADNTRANRAVSLFGLVVILFCFWATSKHRRAVNWRTVIVGMLSQYVIGLFVLRTGVGYSIFSFIAARAGDFLGFAKDGVAFLTNEATANLGMFFFGVIPAIVFFISVVQVLYYIGFVQWFVRKFATFVFWAMNVSGAEAVVAAATPFIGQGESAMLVRPFVPHMTKAEIHQIMTCGFATISGSVLVGYIGLGLNAEALVSSCIMSIPASLAISKLRYPEVEESLTAGQVVMPESKEEKSENALHAFANGAMLGLRIAGAIIASLLCIISLVALANGLLTWWGRYLNIGTYGGPELTLQTIFSYLLYPVSFLLGVSREGNDIILVAKLIAEKVITVSPYVYAIVVAARWKGILCYSGCGAMEGDSRLQVGSKGHCPAQEEVLNQ